MKILSRKITEATVNNLYPGREYEFMVLSQDKHGDGMFSKAVRIFTQPSTINHYFNCSVKQVIRTVNNLFSFLGSMDDNSPSEYRSLHGKGKA